MMKFCLRLLEEPPEETSLESISSGVRHPPFSPRGYRPITVRLFPWSWFFSSSPFFFGFPFHNPKPPANPPRIFPGRRFHFSVGNRASHFHFFFPPGRVSLQKFDSQPRIKNLFVFFPLTSSERPYFDVTPPPLRNIPASPQSSRHSFCLMETQFYVLSAFSSPPGHFILIFFGAFPTANVHSAFPHPFFAFPHASCESFRNQTRRTICLSSHQ